MHLVRGGVESTVGRYNVPPHLQQSYIYWLPSAGWRSLVYGQAKERLLIKQSSLSTCGQ